MLLEMKNLCKSYGETIALDRLNLQLTPGIYGLLGPNGAGKSTLMKLICMLIQPTDGFVLFDGEDIRMHRSNFLDRLGYMPQHSCLYPDFTVQEYLYYVGALKGMHKKDVTFRTEELLLRTRLMDMKKDKIQTLSGGMQQRLMFAQALLNDPEILILDEPTAGLDPGERVRFRNLLSEFAQERIVLISTHIVSDVEYIAAENAVMKAGKIIAQDTTEGLVKQIEAKVWQGNIPMEQLARWEHRLRVVNLRNEPDGTVTLRYLADAPQLPDSVPAQPRLEDLYLWLFPEEMEEAK